MKILFISSHGSPRNTKLWSGTPANVISSLEEINGIDVDSMFTLRFKFIDTFLLGIESILQLERRRSKIRHIVTSFFLYVRTYRRIQNYDYLLFSDIEGNPEIFLKMRKKNPPKIFRLLDSTEAQWEDVHLHFSNNLRRYRYQKARENRILKHFDGFFVLTKATKDSLINDYCIEERNIKILRTGLGQKLDLYEKSTPRESRDTKVLLTVAKGEHWRKGVDVILEAFSKNLLENDYELRAILGKNFEGSVPNRVTNFGTVSLQELKLNFELSDYFVLPCRFEPYGLVFIEAVRMGLPIVTTTNSGLGIEFINSGWPGMLVEANSLSLANGLRALGALEPITELELSDLQKEILQSFSWTKMAADIVQEWITTK